MSDTPELEALARRYLDLWQDQLGRMADDPATVDMFARMFTLMTRSAQAFSAAAASDGSSPDHGVDDAGQAATGGASAADTEADTQPDPPGNPADDPADGAAAPAAVSGARGMDVSGILRRLDALEGRLARLEARCGPAAGSREQRDGEHRATKPGTAGRTGRRGRTGARSSSSSSSSGGRSA